MRGAFGLRFTFSNWQSISLLNTGRRSNMLGTILIVVLIVALIGALPRWSHSSSWGYYPTGGMGLILMIVVILLVLGRI
jgi:FtsH-binding integral membrane protein